MKSTVQEETKFRDLRKDSGQYRLKMERVKKSMVLRKNPRKCRIQ